MKTIASFQFGNVYLRRRPGWSLVPSSYAPCCTWVGSVTDGAAMHVKDPVLEGHATHTQAASLLIGLPRGRYEFTIQTFDPGAGHGPFSLKANGEFVLRDIVAKAGKLRTCTFRCTSNGSPVHLEFLPHLDGDFLVNSLVIRGPAGARLFPVFRTAPPAVMPVRRELAARGGSEPRRALRGICDWLLANRRPDGFIGDIWYRGGFHWYTTSMPLRALLAGYDILGKQAYLDACLGALDIFVGEQLPNGAFMSVFRGKPTVKMGKAELAQIMKYHRLPLSDIGSVVTTLAVACTYASGARQRRYVESVRQFCDRWALHFQMKDGGFPDGQWPGYTSVYSCATAIQASQFSLAAKVCSNRAYLDVARRAIGFLLPDWREDGRMIGRAPHWTVRNRKPFVMETLYFGDQWYYDEGFITTALHAVDAGFRARVEQALHRRVFGTHGLFKALNGSTWWPVQDIWNNAKSIGMVQTLLHVHRAGRSVPELDRALDDMRRILCAPEYVRRLGVMPEDAERPACIHGLTTWSGMRMEATGFAGMTLAETIKPGVLYLAAR
ncbi:MAG: hypothetical protein HY343_00390 [Lentisphaerae bacterium]|nr:hypothetical protein [Lentisphaerota bacterium]